MSLSAVQMMRKLRENLEIIYIAKPSFAAILQNHRAIDKVLTSDKPIPEGVLLELGEPCPCATYESRCKDQSGAFKIEKNRTEIFTLAAGLPWMPEDITSNPVLYLTENEKTAVSVKHPAIGIELRTAEIWRNYPHMKKLARMLSKKYNVYAFGVNDGLHLPRIRNIVGRPLREVMSYIANMDLMFCPDSGLMHIAGALGVPLLALVAPTDPKVRLGSYPNAKWISVECAKFPCWYNPCHGFHAIQPCLTAIAPRKIMTQIKEML
jgi:ADP-heptose:LPS heptosyltransferase